jgi:hypothetical protein
MDAGRNLDVGWDDKQLIFLWGLMDSRSNVRYFYLKSSKYIHLCPFILLIKNQLISMFQPLGLT